LGAVAGIKPRTPAIRKATPKIVAAIFSITTPPFVRI
jgi:hypothetical protein